MELLHLVSIGLFVLLPVVADADTFKGIKSTIASVENSLAGVRSRLSSLENKLKKNKRLVCEPGWDSYKGHCYYFSGNTKTWIEAEIECRKMSSNLVKVDNAAESNWLKTTSKAKNSGAHRWIGAREVNGIWEWVSDLSPLTFTSWGPNEPNNAKENCAHIGSGKSFNWNDNLCTEKFNFICEKDVVSCQ